MAGDEFTSVPVIDVSPLLRPSSEGAGGQRAELDEGAQAVAQAMGRACRDVGFFYVTGHGISEELQAKLESQAKAFFSRPMESKRMIGMSRGGRAWRGFFACGEELTNGAPDMKEGLYFGSELGQDHPLVAAGTPMHGPNLFPDDMPELRKAVLDYIDAVTELGHGLMHGVSASLGLPPDYFREHFFSPTPLVLFRIFNYPAQPAVASNGSETERWGVGEHTDYGVLTILKQDECGGLQVKNRNNHWIEAPPVPGSFVINIGDMLEKMTAGLYRSTPHRVRTTRGDRDRLSFPFFFDPAFNATVTPVTLPANLVDTSQIERSSDGYVRWDGARVEDFAGKYRDYLLPKVSKVFPDLAKATA